MRAWRSISSVLATKSWRPLARQLREPVELDVGEHELVVRLAVARRVALAGVGAAERAAPRQAERGARALVDDADHGALGRHAQSHVELGDQRIAGVHVEVRVVRRIGAGVDVDALEPRGERIADVLGLPDAVRLHVQREVEPGDVDIAQVEDRRRRVGEDAGAEAGADARVERGDDADDRAIVGVQRVRLAGLLEQRLAAVDPQVAEHEVVVAEHQRVDIDLGGDAIGAQQQLARLALRRGIGVRPVIGRTVLVRVTRPQLIALFSGNRRAQCAVVPHADVAHRQSDPTSSHDFLERCCRPLDRPDLDPAAHPLVEDRRDVVAEVAALELDAQDTERGTQDEHQRHADDRDPAAPTSRGGRLHRCSGIYHGASSQFCVLGFTIAAAPRISPWSCWRWAPILENRTAGSTR